MPSIDNSVLPEGSLILVTGANGFTGSHICDQFLHYGYKVRGAVRNAQKCAWERDLFDSKYGKGRFELVEVADMAADGALDEAAKGASAFVHTTTVLDITPNPNDVIPGSIDLATAGIKAAYAAESVKRFVFLSSSTAAFLSHPAIPAVTATEDTWNEAAVEAAWADPPYERERMFAVYAASKTQAEQAVWKFHRENAEKRSDLTVNTVLPNFLFGKVLDPVNQGYTSTGAFIPELYKGNVTPLMSFVTPQYFVNVQDAARLHVAAATFPHVKEQRLFVFAGRFSMDKLIDILAEQNPGRKFLDHFSGGEDPNEVPPAKKAEALLREMGFSGYTSLEDTVAQNSEGLRE